VSSANGKNGGPMRKVRSYLNYFLIGYCAFAVATFLWSVVVVRNEPFLFYSIESVGFLCGGGGILLYLNGWRIPGLIAIAGQIAAFVYNHTAFRKSLVKNLFFWLFLCILMGCIVDFIIQLNSRRSGTKEAPYRQ
jgi:hypothetical protein